METSKARTSSPSHLQMPTMPQAAGCITLGPNLLFNPATATLICQDSSILLTKRENAVLKILLKSPYVWHAAGELAHKLAKMLTVPIEAHSIEQTICGLRRKLGESAKQPRLLHSHYGHGYRIVLPENPS
jgi:DNA-binding response OmpR family regulator